MECPLVGELTEKDLFCEVVSATGQLGDSWDLLVQRAFQADGVVRSGSVRVIMDI